MNGPVAPKLIKPRRTSIEDRASENTLPVYLDQNVLSALRSTDKSAEELRRTLERLKKIGAIYVCSATHIDECRASSRPDSFVQILDELPVYLMELNEASDTELKLSLEKTKGLLLAPADETHLAKTITEDLLRIAHFAAGWLGQTDAKDLKREIAGEVVAFWDHLLRDIDQDDLGAQFAVKSKRMLTSAKKEMLMFIDDLPFERAKNDWQKGWDKLKKGLPANFAQLDQIDDERAVAFLFSCFGDQEQQELEKLFPRGFWKSLASRKTGELAGFSFMLFMLGLVRVRRVKTGKIERRKQHFLSQWRDCVHIEHAARCAAFITCDSGAARLASSVYAYAGVQTKVLEVKVTKPTN